MKTKQRPLTLEHLQRRDLFTVDSLAWDEAGSLRLSFVPDGTLVGDQVSNLDSVMSQSPAGTAWRDSVVKAFQIWSQYAAINVGVVSDSGAPIGTAGPTRGDERFGEIRIAGLPMTNDTWAAAVSHNKLSSGSWAGDMFFNTAANWNQHPDDLLRVALHEAGHVLGLPHNADPTSPMHEHGVPDSLTPAASDIAVLQQLYGVRGADANELNKANDTQGDATRMRFSDVASTFDGTKPLIHYGEITQATDRDIFFFEVPQSHKSTTTVHVESRGLSQLQFRLTVKNDKGNVVSVGENTALQGGEVHLQIPATSNGGKYYLQIDAIGDSFNRIGSYAVVAELDGKVAVPYATTLTSVQKAHRWFASSATVLGSLDVGALAVSQNTGALVEDRGGNDSSGSATRINPFLENSERTAARTIGSISSGTDVDFYRFRSPKPPTGVTFGMLVQIDAIERNGLMPEIEVRDELDHVLPVDFLVNGNGEIKVWVPGIAANNDYTVKVRGVTVGHNIGNYELSATFQADQPVLPLIAQSHVTSAEPETKLYWYVARPQLFTLALDSDFGPGPSIPVWANIYDSELRIVYHLTSQSDQFRTGTSLLLLPGTYYLQLGARFDESLGSSQQATIRVLGTADNEPLGPAPVDPASSPIFGCPDVPDKFCYPPDFETTEPFVLLPEPPFDLPTTTDFPIDPPASDGFFGTNFQRNNADLPFDSNNDGAVTAVDALLIINQINSYGPGLAPAPPVNLGGMLDTNNDGYITSLDALLVINRLNQAK